MRQKVYLSGPMAGLTQQEATDWREKVAHALRRASITPLSPMRDLTYRSKDSRISASNDVDDGVRSFDPAMTTDRGINTRDYNDTITSDLIFIYLLGAKKVSIGTVIEIAWAYERRIPTVVVMENEGNLHDHAMLRDMISYRVDTLDRGIEVALSVLNASYE